MRALLGRAALAAGLAMALAAGPARAQDTSVSGEITLMAYSGIFQDNYTKAVVEPFMRRFPNVKVTYYPGQTSAAMLGLLRAQKSAPQIDLSIMDVSVSRVGNQEGVYRRLDAAQVPNLSQLHEMANVEAGFGPAVTFDHLVIVYNRDQVNPPIRRWVDLWDRRFDGKLAISASPNIQGLGLTVIMNRVEGQADYRANIDRGVAKLRALAPMVQTWNPAPDGYTMVLNGAVLAATGWNARAQFYHDQSQGKLQVVLPEDGSVFQINTINIVNGRPNARAAHAFLNYAIGAEAQKAFTELMFYGPVNRTAQIAPAAAARTAADPANLARMVAIDWNYVATQRDRWNERWRREILRGSR